MAWKLEGAYFENCNCDFVCPCTIAGLPATGDRCTFLLVFHIQRGQIDGLDVASRTVAFVGDTPKVMGDLNWRVGWIVDEKASKEQFDKLAAVFSGKMGGVWADFVPAFGTILGIEQQPIEFGESGHKHHVKIGKDIEVEVEDFVRPGMSEPTRLVGLGHPANSTLTIAKPTSSRIKAFGMEFDAAAGKSGFSAPFNWAG
jgi:hypothetical protein